MTQLVQIQQYRNGRSEMAADFLAVEEPLEIRVVFGPEGGREMRNLSVTMRTPGADADLAAGFLFTEGLVKLHSDIAQIDQIDPNTVSVQLNPALAVDFQRLERNFYTTSSCGVCGKSSIDAVRVFCSRMAAAEWEVSPEVLLSLPGSLRRVQETFEATGGLHASAVFTPEGELLAMREDVGRHNALDKLIGHYFLQGRTPLSEVILLLSGRASFELLQKAAVAGIRFVAAVGAPSSLAVETARDLGVRLVGFLREGRYNEYL